MLVGLKTKLVVVGVLVVGLILFGTIRYIQDTGKNELKLEQLNEQIETRQRIDNAVRTAPRDVDNALRLLRERQDSRD